MDKYYLNRLEDDTRFLVQSIEESCGLEITIEIDSSRAPENADQPVSLACDVDENCAKLLIPSKEYFPDSSVVHELLHIKRFLVDGIPRVVICDEYDDWSPERETGLAKLDNALEHLLIVPEELARRPVRRDYWRSLIESALSHLQCGLLPSHDVRYLALLHWAFLHIVLPDPGLVKKCGVVLQSNGLGDLASSYVESVIRLLETKNRLVRATFSYFEISLEGICLQTIDARRNTVSETKLRDVEIAD